MIDTTLLFGGALISPPLLLGSLLVLVVVVVLGRFLLAVTWRVLTIALGVVLGIWLLGLLGISV